MKNSYYFQLFAFLFLGQIINAQVGIGTITPDASAILELTSSDKGLLAPRMTTVERDAILAPTTGLLIYNTTTSGFNYYDSGWRFFSPSYNSVNATDAITTVLTTNELATGMTITPPFAGKYKVTFNSLYKNAPIINGPIATVSTSDCRTDLQTAYDQLMALPATNTTHATVLGSGEVFTPGVYTFDGATSTIGTLNFDANGNPDALFVFRIAAAFSTAANTKMVLLHGAKACNIFWVVEAATSFASSTKLKGTVIAREGAVAMATNGELEGRLFSFVGAINFGPGKAIIPSGNSIINLGTLSSFIFFTANGAVTNAGTSVFTGNIGTSLGLISGFESPTVVGGAFLQPDSSIITTATFPNNSNTLATFSIYQNGILIPNASKMLTSTAKSANISLQAIATIEANEAIEIRWNTKSEKIQMGNRTLTLVKVQ